MKGFQWFALFLFFILLPVSSQAAEVYLSPNTLSFLSGDTVSVDIGVSGLEASDLVEFDIDLAYDDWILEYDGYALYGGLGDLEDYTQAYDGSWGEDFGSVNVYEQSYLDSLAFQEDSFVLATITFIALEDGDTSGIYIDYADLTLIDANPVPVPPTVVLLGSCLLGLTGLGRSFKLGQGRR